MSIFDEGEGVKDFEPCMGHGIKGSSLVLGPFIILSHHFLVWWRRTQLKRRLIAFGDD